ncbi:hypothetical protein, partial [Megasphaera sp.]|uniref:hypothetical protein n=1 Tax=Megasphaera sp. TaxID=2023260 RepID=UPI0040299DDE
MGGFAYEAGFVVGFDFEGQFFAVLFDQGGFGRDGQAYRLSGDVFDDHADADGVIAVRELRLAGFDK